MSSVDDRWLDELYRANFALVLRLCARILRNPDDAADAAQEVFLVAMDSLRPEAPPAQARSWLLTVARNHCIDLLRRRKRLGQALVNLNSGSPGEVDFESAVADRDLVDIVFSKLTLRERRALWESVVEHRPLADIAVRLKLSYMAAAQVVHRARQHAVEMAARVAVVVAGWQVSRFIRRLAATPNRAVAIAAVPVMMIASQSSSSTGPAHPAQLAPAITRHQAQPGPSAGNPAAGASNSVVGPTGSQPNGMVPPVPGLPVPGLPSVAAPSLPPVPLQPLPLPALPNVPNVVPSASPLPGLH